MIMIPKNHIASLAVAMIVWSPLQLDADRLMVDDEVKTTGILGHRILQPVLTTDQTLTSGEPSISFSLPDLGDPNDLAEVLRLPASEVFSGAELQVVLSGCTVASTFAVIISHWFRDTDPSLVDNSNGATTPQTTCPIMYSLTVPGSTGVIFSVIMATAKRRLDGNITLDPENDRRRLTGDSLSNAVFTATITNPPTAAPITTTPTATTPTATTPTATTPTATTPTATTPTATTPTATTPSATTPSPSATPAPECPPPTACEIRDSIWNFFRGFQGEP